MKYTRKDLVSCAMGDLCGVDAPRLPSPPMLMLDNITNILTEGGEFGKGVAEGDMEISPDLWFFDCHFQGDPVMPGCLMLDGLWQLTGFFFTANGYKGKGRAIEVESFKLFKEVTQAAKRISYRVDIKKIVKLKKMHVAVASGTVYVDSEKAAHAANMKVCIL